MKAITIRALKNGFFRCFFNGDKTKAITIREKFYTIKTTCYDIYIGHSIIECIVFSSISDLLRHLYTSTDVLIDMSMSKSI